MTGGMEPEVKKYLKKVLHSLFAGLLWLLVNVTAGIYYGLAFHEGHKAIINILFYFWLALSLGLLLWYYYRVWKTH